MPFNPGGVMGAWRDVTGDLGLGVERQAPERLAVTATVHLHATGGNQSRVTASVDGTVVAHGSVDTRSGGLTGNPDAIQDEVFTLLLEAGETYRFDNDLDPAGTNTLDQVVERPF